MKAFDAVQTYFDAWNAHSPDAILKSLATHGSYSDPCGGENLSGEGLKNYTRAIFTAFPDLHLVMTSTTHDGANKFTVEWLGKGTHKGPLLGSPATGRTFNWLGVDLIEVLDGKVSSVKGYFDQLTLLKQLGLL